MTRYDIGGQGDCCGGDGTDMWVKGSDVTMVMVNTWSDMVV